MKRKMGILWLAIAFLILIARCGSGSQPSNPTVGLSTPPATMPTFVPAETIAANPDYMADCRSKYPQISQSQAEYKGIYPGISSEQDVQQVLGSPTKKIQVIQKEIEWLYNSNLAVILDDNIVSAIYTQALEPLQNYLIVNGCPDVIFAVDGNQHPSGDYASLLLAYHNIGMDIMVGSFPTQITDIPVQISFFPPGTLREALSGTSILDDSARAKPVFWREAVK